MHICVVPFLRICKNDTFLPDFDLKVRSVGLASLCVCVVLTWCLIVLMYCGIPCSAVSNDVVFTVEVDYGSNTYSVPGKMFHITFS